jgi:hypothetical protein
VRALSDDRTRFALRGAMLKRQIIRNKCGFLVQII